MASGQGADPQASRPLPASPLTFALGAAVTSWKCVISSGCAVAGEWKVEGAWRACAWQLAGFQTRGCVSSAVGPLLRCVCPCPSERHPDPERGLGCFPPPHAPSAPACPVSCVCIYGARCVLGSGLSAANCAITFNAHKWAPWPRSLYSDPLGQIMTCLAQSPQGPPICHIQGS